VTTAEKELFMDVKAHTAEVLLVNVGKKELKRHLDSLNQIFKRLLLQYQGKALK
jgi:hypothetical protein